MNYNDDYVCDKCVRNRLFNNNTINNILGYNNEKTILNLIEKMKFCPNCQKLFNGTN